MSFSVDGLKDEDLRVVDFGLISSCDGDLAVFADLMHFTLIIRQSTTMV